MKQAKSLNGSRGKALEKTINKLLTVIQKQGFHGHKNQPERCYSGQFISGEPFDYEIFTDKVKWCFDAKECKSKVWNLKTNAKLTQINALKQCKNAGMDAFFLVYFYPDRKLVRFDVDQVISSITNGVKSLSSADGIEVDLNELLN